MSKYAVQVVESRDLLFIVEASSSEEAEEIAMDLDGGIAETDSYRSREIDWSQMTE